MPNTAQNICYTLHTKDSVTQSLRSRGALRSYTKIQSFLDSQAVNGSINNATIEFHLFGVRFSERKAAKRVYRSIEAKFGKPTYSYSSSLISRYIWGSNDINSWTVEADSLEDALLFLDAVGGIPELSSRPPIYITAMYDFWLKHPKIDPADEQMKSNLVVFLSPSSNTGALNLVTPFTIADEDFNIFRQHLQKDCPFVLKDKYFYIRKFNKSGEEYYRRLFDSKAAD